MCIYIYIYIYCFSIRHHLLEAISETANVLELRQKLLYTTPSEWWWWCIKSVFRMPEIGELHIVPRISCPSREMNINDNLYIYIYIYIYV